MSLKVWMKDVVKNKLRTSAYEFDFCYARYWGNRKQELYAVMRCLLKRDRQSSDQVFADYSTNKKYDFEELLQELENYDVISFDIFDTLLFRKVSKPTDVFCLVENKTGLAGYAQKRKMAELNARGNKHQETGSNEVTIEEIYQTLPLNSLENFHQLMAVEMQTEREICYANEDLKTLIKRLKENKKQVIAVSDMYLPETEICELLDQNGFQGIDQVYVSCEYGISKSDGKLFGLVKREIGGQKSICHIGDNFYSDVMAQKGKINKAIHYIKR